ncbi:MAG: hypothetical protein ACTHN5_18885 [Phycisphaerae bacterium]
MPETQPSPQPCPQAASRSLALTGITSNTRTLLAPAASAWILLASQCALGASASDMFCGVMLALIISILAALAHARLAAAFPAAGPAYFYVLDAFRKKAAPSQPFQLLLFWGSHLYYYLFPAVILAATSILGGYLLNQFFPTVSAGSFAFCCCVPYALLLTFIASRGVAGSSPMNVAINVLQISALLIFCLLAINYGLHTNPDPGRVNLDYFPSMTDILRPHSGGGVLLQAALALVLFAGFESTATAGRSASGRINRGILAFLVVQGVFCYLLQYFAIESAFTWKFGIEDAAKSPAPLGEMMRIIGLHTFGTLNAGWWFMFLEAVLVFLALMGIGLSALTNAARVAYASRYAKTPVRSLWAIGVISAIIACLLAVSPTLLLYLFFATSAGLLLLYLATAVAALRKR